MSAKIVTVSPTLVWTPEEISRLWFFPEGSEFLRYAPHFHAIHHSGFRQNLPLNYMFVVVLEGKLSIKDFSGFTTHKIDVRDQVWFMRGQEDRTPKLYAKILQPIGGRPLFFEKLEKAR